MSQSDQNGEAADKKQNGGQPECTLSDCIRGSWRCMKAKGLKLLACLKKIENLIIAAATVAMAFIGVVQCTALIDSARDQKNSDRAFVYVGDIKINGLRDSAGILWWWITPIWENGGNTPARFLDVESNCPASETVSDPFRYKDLQPYGNTRVLGPKSKTEGINCKITEATVDSIKTGKSQGYFTAIARYRDVFDESPFNNTWGHVTEYCMEIRDIIGDYTDPNTRLGMVFRPCEDHNCTDEECPAPGPK